MWSLHYCCGHCGSRICCLPIFFFLCNVPSELKWVVLSSHIFVSAPVGGDTVLASSILKRMRRNNVENPHDFGSKRLLRQKEVMDTLRSTRGKVTRRKAQGKGGTNQEHNVQCKGSGLISGKHSRDKIIGNTR